MNVTAISTTAPSVRIWAIYRNPNDYPDKWVLREWSIRDGQLQSGEAQVGASVDEVRGLVPVHARSIERDPTDAACIVEAWI